MVWVDLGVFVVAMVVLLAVATKDEPPRANQKRLLNTTTQLLDSPFCQRYRCRHLQQALSSEVDLYLIKVEALKQDVRVVQARDGMISVIRVRVEGQENALLETLFNELSQDTARTKEALVFVGKNVARIVRDADEIQSLEFFALGGYNLRAFQTHRGGFEIHISEPCWPDIGCEDT